jgi:hypothetical protein
MFYPKFNSPLATQRRALPHLFGFCLGVICTMTGGGCSRLNLWEGPNYRDDPVVSENTQTGKPGENIQEGSSPAAQPVESSIHIKSLRANR